MVTQGNRAKLTVFREFKLAVEWPARDEPAAHAYAPTKLVRVEAFVCARADNAQQSIGRRDGASDDGDEHIFVHYPGCGAAAVKRVHTSMHTYTHAHTCTHTHTHVHTHHTLA